ncbi:MAG: GTPase HflX [Defluviitaleaceae bacterium]|nr:GTPase HflX [Defluviitaleaceae bacterium]
MFDTDILAERAILISAGGADCEESLDELALLAETAGAEVVGRLSQKRDAVHPGLYLGKGKIEELKQMAEELGATCAIADDELTSSQLKKISAAAGIKIMDRTLVILDIFAARASSAEGKTQVELAQLKYRLSHLAGLGTSLSRQGGGGVGTRGFGIGTRGPGETKLETDRRHIRSRVNQLESELKEITEVRGTQRERREKSNIPVVSLVGYTNAGKSTLMNAVCDAGVFAEDKLFATLDTTTRKFKLGAAGMEALLTDTVGFINKLPHNLIDAFRATLDELKFSDVLLHVADMSNPAVEAQMKVVDKTLEQLGCGGKPIIIVYNKSDKAPDFIAPVFAANFSNVQISAANRTNIDLLLEKVEDALRTGRKKMRMLLPYTEGGLLSRLHEDCEIVSETHEENGTLVTAFITPEYEGRVLKYVQ